MTKFLKTENRKQRKMVRISLWKQPLLLHSRTFSSPQQGTTGPMTRDLKGQSTHGCRVSFDHLVHNLLFCLIYQHFFFWTAIPYCGYSSFALWPIAASRQLPRLSVVILASYNAQPEYDGFPVFQPKPASSFYVCTTLPVHLHLILFVLSSPL